MDVRGWSRSEAQCLVSIWAEDSVQRRLQGTCRNRSVYEEISRKMEERGFGRSWRQCQRKVKHLKTPYNKARKSRSDRDRLRCPFYEELDRVLGNRPSFVCPAEGDGPDWKLESTEDQEPVLNSTEDQEPVLNSTVLNSTVLNSTVLNSTGLNSTELNSTVLNSTGLNSTVLNSTVHTVVVNVSDPEQDYSDDHPDAPSPSSETSASSAQSPTSSRNRPSSSGTRPKEKRSRLASEALRSSRSSRSHGEVLLRMQRAQHEHEERMFGMMLQSVAALVSTITNAPPAAAAPGPELQQEAGPSDENNNSASFTEMF